MGTGRARRRRRFTDPMMGYDFHLKMTPQMREGIEKMALASGLSNSEWVRRTVETALVSDSDYLDQQEAEVKAMLEDVQKKKEAKLHEDNRIAEESRLYALDRQNKIAQKFDAGMSVVLAQVAKGIPASRALKDAGLDDLIILNEKLVDRIPDDAVKEAAKKLVAE